MKITVYRVFITNCLDNEEYLYAYFILKLFHLYKFLFHLKISTKRIIRSSKKFLIRPTQFKKLSFQILECQPIP